MPGADTEWAKANEALFEMPNTNEGAFVATIYPVAHFQANIEKQKLVQYVERASGMPAADGCFSAVIRRKAACERCNFFEGTSTT